MANEFNIRQLTAGAINYVGLPYPVLGVENVDLPNVNQIGRALRGKDLLGRPIFEDFVLDGYQFPFEPLLTVTRRKQIVETIVVGSDRSGTVKEFICAEDFQIRIEGILLANKEYPYIAMDRITELCERAEALEVESDMLNVVYRIQRLVIKDYGFGNMKGKPYSQSYYITAVSDQDFYAELSNPVNN